MKKILILIAWYLPGYKAGGPIQTIKNLTDYLGDEYEFYILTGDRDLGDKVPYPGIQYHTWNRIGNARVQYVKPGGFTLKTVKQCAKNKDILYLCGCYNDYFRTVMLLKNSGRLKQRVIVAPMGIFSPGALRLKHTKKIIYLKICKLFGWFKNVEWSVTGEQERRGVQQIIGQTAICFEARDIPRAMNQKPLPMTKERGQLKVIFLSRISPMKNLWYALDVIKELKGDICFDIYGTTEDEVYYKTCKKKTEQLPENVKCRYMGEANPEKVLEIFSGYHVFLFPTKGENYGHVIYESMAGGCIPVLSDRTPWGELEAKKIGRVIPLEKSGDFVKALQQMADMAQDEYEVWQKRAVDYAWNYSKGVNCQGYRDMFQHEGM